MKEMGKRFGVRIAVYFFIFFFLFLSFSSFVSAACSIGATPLEMGAKAKPGTTVEVTWNLYNLYGDRTTHIAVTKLSGPDWTITYNPALHTANYDVSGVIENRTENLAIENMSVALTIPAEIPEGMNYLKHPSREGYIPVKLMKIYITVPENAKLGQNFAFAFQAKGDCFTGPGAVIPAAALQLKVNITTANDVFYEKPVDNAKGKSGTGTGFSIFGMGTATTLLLITTIVFMFILFLLLMRGMRKSAREKKQSSGAGGSDGNVNKTDGNKPGGGQMPSISFSSS